MPRSDSKLSTEELFEKAVEKLAKEAAKVTDEIWKERFPEYHNKNFRISLAIALLSDVSRAVGDHLE